MIRLEIPNKTQMKQIRRLYREAFPAAERKPFRIILKKMREGTVDLFAIAAGERFLGLMVAFRYGELLLLDYFAVAADARSLGIGAKAIELLRDRFPDSRILLEIEEGSESEMLRRKAFYLRHRFREAGLRVWLFGVPMEILTDKGTLVWEEYRDLMERFMGKRLADAGLKLRND